jgi:transcriptional regulator with XRE-family HTH domain
MSDRIIHFGEFVRWKRISQGKTTEAFGREVGLTARRIIAIETMAKPDVQHTTIVALARAFAIDPEHFDQAWRSTPVPVTRRKVGPTTDEARRFNQACMAAGVAPVEGMRRLRSWLVAQSAEIQQQALSFVRPGTESDEMFTDLVDHVQDPAEAAQKRINRRAASAAKSPGSASTSAGKRR